MMTRNHGKAGALIPAPALKMPPLCTAANRRQNEHAAPGQRAAHFVNHQSSRARIIPPDSCALQCVGCGHDCANRNCAGSGGKE
jgi:hypothetical protein